MGFGSSQYVNASVKKAHYYIRKHNIWNLPANSDTSIKTPYQLELNATP